ncbi:MAG: rhodanese-like domain-containing protein [Gaiella sp.]
MATGVQRRTLDEMLADACAKITRHSPVEARDCIEAGGILVDIRSDTEREGDGIVPGSLHIPRTVLEWRADPDGSHRNPYLTDLGQPVVLICQHGCSSVLAAANLVELGYLRAGDVVGGFVAWREAGLPTGSIRTRRARRPGGLAGMTGPELANFSRP